MSEQDDLLAELPAPNPEEPASLRRDIADELRDHLECAARREAVTHQDPNEIERRVLARFGDPRQIARRLWFDWMKEKLMTQKITLILVTIVAIASAAACGLMWNLAQDFQAASIKAQEASQELLLQNQKLIEQFSQRNQTSGEPSLMEWVPAKIRVVKQTENQDPGEGFEVSLSGFAYSDGEKAFLEEEADQSGIVDFGRVRPGSYIANVQSPWGQDLSRQVTVKPGAPFVQTILAPEGPPPEYRLRPVIEWSKWLEGRDVAVLLEVERQITSKVGEETWYDRRHEYWLVRRDGRIAKYDQRPDPYHIDGAASLKFNSEPTILGESVLLTDTSGTIKFSQLLRVGSADDFTGSTDTVELLDEWFQLRGYPQDASTRYTAPSADGDAVQEVPIQIPAGKAATAFARLAADSFPDYPQHEIVDAARTFLESDANRDLALSPKEILSWSDEFRLRIGNEPISFETFVPKYIERIRELGEQRAKGRRAADP